MQILLSDEKLGVGDNFVYLGDCICQGGDRELAAIKHGCQQILKTLKSLDFEKLTLRALKFVVLSSKTLKTNAMTLKIYVFRISFSF